MQSLPDSTIETLARNVAALRQEVEFATFWLGTRVPGPIEKEEAMALRYEVNHRVGLRVIELCPDLVPTPQRPDARVTLHLKDERATIKVRSLYFYGRYLKFSRKIPQSKWPCRRCHGRGCAVCNFTGKRFQQTVEEMLGAKLLPVAKAVGTKLHSVGREDVDARMLGDGRPFVIELLDPKVRTFDIGHVEGEFNREHGDDAAVRQFQRADTAMMERVNSLEPEKSYRAVVECLSPAPRAAVERLASLAGTTVGQETPCRVLHRRANKIRRRLIRTCALELPPHDDPVRRFEMVLRVQSGTYIKELISGDEGRARPSVASLLDRPCQCVELDVLDVHCDPLRL